MGLRSDLLNVVLADLPSSDSTLSETSNPEVWDALLGGKLGSGRWGRFETGYGTTCGVAANGWLLAIGAPAVMINAVAPGGSGFTFGAHITRINEGAKSLGWLRTPTRGELPTFRPGDLYEINHTTTDGSDGTHIGVILSVKPSADGESLVVETADGGQGSRAAQSAKRSIRTFSLSSGAHPIVVSSPSGTGWLDRWVAIGGDESDEIPGVGGGAPGTGETSPGEGLALAIGIAGVGLLLIGAAWLAGGGGSPPRATFAMRSVPYGDDLTTLWY